MGLRAGHDLLYFGRWRRMDATTIDVRKAHHQMKRLLGEISIALETEDMPAARLDLEKALGHCTPRSRAREGRTLSGTWTTPSPTPTG